ncbi:hypothetical protein AMR76_06555 [Vibrio furnissii]|uniref:Uncharacterized protein n=2 Tax=Vibrio furnissii TaxID=29494 RepID=A0A0Q2MGB1_VIBFU|nr:hypothetical protein AMR76_06555 [Vibrio furnissii]OQQ02347.1 hypothetical protein BK411_22105 [Vibrio splendidus]
MMKKIFSITSIKTALIALITIILAITSWQTADAFIISQGVPSTVAPLCIFGGAYGLAYIIVGFVMYCKGYFVKWCKETKESFERTAKKESELEVFQADARKAIPHLPSRQIEILMELHEEEHVQYHRYNKDISNLLKLNYIYALSFVNERDYLFAISPDVFEVVDSYLKKQREDLLVKFCEGLSHKDIEFLRIFFDEKIPFGAPDTKMMQALVWRSGEEMIRKGVLKSHDDKGSHRHETHIVLELVADTEKKLQELQGFGSSYRQEAELDSSLLMVGGINHGPS